MELVDTVGIVAAKNSDDPETRPRTVPIWGDEYDWWSLAVKRQLKAVGWTQEDLANSLGIHPSLVSRCITRKVPTYDLLLAISDELKVAYPVILPESEGEALRLAEEKRLYKREVEAKKIKAGVPEIAKKDQAPGVVSEHAVRSRKEAGKKAARQRAAGHRP